MIWVKNTRMNIVGRCLSIGNAGRMNCRSLNNVATVNLAHYRNQSTEAKKTKDTLSGPYRASSTSPAHSPSGASHDIVIVGGGPAGLTLAAALKANQTTRSLNIALVEASDLDNVRKWDLGDNWFENRVSSLTPRSVKFLKKIGAWEHVDHERIQDYDQMKVWDGCSGARIEFDPSVLAEYGEIAFMTENLNLQRALLRRLDEVGIDAIHCAKVGNISSETQHALREEPLQNGSIPWPTVELENGHKLSARLLVGADGANSPVRRFAGIKSRGWDYNRHGLVATVRLEWEDFRSVAWQRFLTTGPIALLPLPNGFASLVWSTTPELAQWLKSLSPQDFCAMVNAGFRLGPVDLKYMSSLSSGLIDEVQWRLETTVLHDEDNTVPIPVVDVLENTRASFPLKMKHADTYISERVALVGDAAHTTHPLAGQGLNMGQSDVEHLVNALELAMNRGLDVGSTLSLEPYWANAYTSNHFKLGVVDKLHKLYSTDFYPLVQLRSYGLDFVNSQDWIKRFLMRRASD